MISAKKPKFDWQDGINDDFSIIHHLEELLSEIGKLAFDNNDLKTFEIHTNALKSINEWRNL